GELGAGLARLLDVALVPGSRLPALALTSPTEPPGTSSARLSGHRPHAAYTLDVRRLGRVLGGLFLVLGVFWAGRKSGHGLAASRAHWWCPIPPAFIVLRLAVMLAARPLGAAS